MGSDCWVGTQPGLLQAATIGVVRARGDAPERESGWVQVPAFALRVAEKDCLQASPHFAEEVPEVSKALIWP